MADQGSASGHRTSRRERLRWWLWRLVVRHPDVCPARAHGVIVWDGWKDGRGERSIRIGSSCRDDCARNSVCWCGKIRSTEVAR